MLIVINIIGITWILIHYKDFIQEFNVILKQPKKIILVPDKILSCMMCCSFWVSLILTQGLIGISGCISLLMFIVDKYLISTDIKL